MQRRLDRLTYKVCKGLSLRPGHRGTPAREYERDLSRIDRRHDQELYVKLAREAELRAEFEAEVRELTISRGKVLIKLIDRETGQTSYDLVKQLRGGFQAFIWQGVARLFGNDLKDDYDPDVEDRTIEVIVQRSNGASWP